MTKENIRMCFSEALEFINLSLMEAKPPKKPTLWARVNAAE